MMKLKMINSILRAMTLLKEETDRWGGVALYFSKNMSYTRRRDLESPLVELIWCEVKSKEGNYLVGVIYRATGSPFDLWTAIETQLEIAVNTGLPIILVGDWNKDILVGNSMLAQTCVRVGLVTSNNEPTHITEFTSKCIDVVATNCPQLLANITTGSPCMSNYWPLILQKGKPAGPRSSYQREIFKYDLTDWTKVNEELNEAEWPNLDNLDNYDQVAVDWTNLVKQIVQKYTPKNILTIRSKDEKCINPEIKRLMRKRNNQYKKVKNTGKPN